jgi:hypothetical protein
MFIRIEDKKLLNLKLWIECRIDWLLNSTRIERDNSIEIFTNSLLQLKDLKIAKLYDLTISL